MPLYNEPLCGSFAARKAMQTRHKATSVAVKAKSSEATSPGGVFTVVQLLTKPVINRQATDKLSAMSC